MTDDPVPKIEKILATLDGALRRRLVRLGIGEPHHMIMVLAPNGAGVIRSNCGPKTLRAMADMLNVIANQMKPSDSAKLN